MKTVILALSSFLNFAKSFDGLLFNHFPQMINKRIAIWEVRKPDFRIDVIAEIFLQLTLGSSGFLVWRKVLLLNVESSNSHSLDIREHYYMNEGITSLVLVTTPNIMMRTG